jgi:hypothetical protein
MSESISLDDMLHCTDMSIRLTPHEREHLVFSALRGYEPSDIVYYLSPGDYPQVGTVFCKYADGKYGVGVIRRDFSAKFDRRFGSCDEAMRYLRSRPQIGSESVVQFLDKARRS